MTRLALILALLGGCQWAASRPSAMIALDVADGIVLASSTTVAIADDGEARAPAIVVGVASLVVIPFLVILTGLSYWGRHH